MSSANVCGVGNGWVCGGSVSGFRAERTRHPKVLVPGHLWPGLCGREGGLCAASSLLRVRRGPVLRAHTLRSCLSWERDSHGQTGEVERYVPALLLLIVPFLLCLDPFFPEPSQATLTSCGAHCMTTLATITSPR